MHYRLYHWRSAGILSVTVLGFLLHYLFHWTGALAFIGFFAPVNESTWEHLKLGYWAVVLFAVVEYRFIKHHVQNYIAAKTAGLFVLEGTILVLFYGSVFIAGKHFIFIDIFSYILGVVLGQYLTFFLFLQKPFSVMMSRICLAVFIATGLLFGLLTFYPPHLKLFKDANSETYGIANEQ